MDKRRGRPNNELRDAGISGSFRDGAAIHRWHAISEYNKEKLLPMASGPWRGTRVSIARTSLDDNYFVQLANSDHTCVHVFTWGAAETTQIFLATAPLAMNRKQNDLFKPRRTYLKSAPFLLAGC
jgi:hypothetical protein